jgi:uncharacterized protein with PIN domain
MLGKVARWLRILGYDTVYAMNNEDWWILKKALEDERIIITRDKGLCLRARKRNLECFLVDPEGNIIQILAKIALQYKIDLDISIEASRCAVCNGVLEKLGENKWKCTRCKKEYWKGKHWKSINEILLKARAELIRNESRADSNNRGIESRYRENVDRNSKESNKAEIWIGETSSQPI